MNLFENLLNMHEVNKQIKTEANNDKLWSKFSNHYEGFVPIQDMTNYFSLHQFGEFVQWCRFEADLEYDYEKKYRDWDEALNDLYDACGSPNTESIALEKVFTFFSNSDLEEFWNWVEMEYGLDDEEFVESKKVEEGATVKSSYTVNFGHWLGSKSFASKQELVSFLRSHYVELSTKIIYNEDVTDKFKNCTYRVNRTDIENDEANKELFNKGYVAIKDVKENNVEESVELKESHITSTKLLQEIIDNFDNPKEFLGFLIKFLDDSIIERMYVDLFGDLEEATSGIGAGAYTTKAIDMIPGGIKKPKEIKESTKDDYISKIDKETSNVELVNILHKVRANKGLSVDDRKELEDKIRNKVRSIKTEAITEFYGKEWSDEEIQKLIDFTKKNPDAAGYADPSEHADPFNYNGKTYYTIGEGKEIIFDGKDCVVFLTVDEELNRHLSYFEVSYSDDGDGESGPQELTMNFASEVPYKVVEV